MNTERRIPSLTPCAGRCSTVFGDQEVIQWNTYTVEERMAVWQRLDAQLDQILVPMLPMAQLAQVEEFVLSKRVRLLENASQGRKLYHALKICEKNKNLAEESGLGISAEQIKPLWQLFEQKVLALAKASYELAWLRAGDIRQNLLYMEDDE